MANLQPVRIQLPFVDESKSTPSSLNVILSTPWQKFFQAVQVALSDVFVPDCRSTNDQEKRPMNARRNAPAGIARSIGMSPLRVLYVP
jgi:hypothetical protein